MADLNNIFKVQDEFLEEPDMRELEKIAEEVMTPRQTGRRKREEASKEEKVGEEENVERSDCSNSDVSNCPHCNKTLPVGSLQHHLRTAHSQVRESQSFFSLKLCRRQM